MIQPKPLKIAVIGAGLIGARHARLIRDFDGSEIFGIVDPSKKAQMLANSLNAEHFASLDDFLDQRDCCQGVIVATPNHTHREIAFGCIKRGLPCLIEKPLAADVEDARAIVYDAEKMNVPILVGHHRRHHLVCKELKSLIENGELGQIVGAQLAWALRKPAEYFAEGDWRVQRGGGPAWINMIHEIDLLRYFVGEITEVSSMLSNLVRGNEVEDTGVINLRFENGALASAILSDATPSPWHFEGGSGENPNIAKTGKDGLRILGTNASVTFPSMIVWSHSDDEGSWGDPVRPETRAQDQNMDGEVALRAQLENFLNVIRGHEVPLVTAYDGMRNVRVIEAMHESAISGRSVLI